MFFVRIDEKERLLFSRHDHNWRCNRQRSMDTYTAFDDLLQACVLKVWRVRQACVDLRVHIEEAGSDSLNNVVIRP